jgi:hypothetical protein
MPRMCDVTITMVGNLFYSLHHQDKAHLQFFTSIGYQRNLTNYLNTRFICVYICRCGVKQIFDMNLKLKIFDFFNISKHQQLGCFYQ